MFVRRYLWLWLILFQAVFVAESRGGESFFAPYSYHNESGKSHLFSPENWLPDDRTGLTMPERFRKQGAENGSHMTNPWSLPVTRWAPAMPPYSGPAFKVNNYAQTPQYTKQASEQNVMPSGPDSSGANFNGWSNLQVSSQPSYVESNWRQRPNFQQSPRFVTPDILDKLNGKQTQQTLPFNAYNQAYQNGFQQQSRCCQNWQRQMKIQNDTRRTYQQANQPDTQQGYRYSNTLMPSMMDAGQLNRERLLYRGDTLPTVPDAAISGLPPMNIFEPLPPVLSSSTNDIDWGTNRFAIDPYGDFLQQ